MQHINGDKPPIIYHPGEEMSGQKLVEKFNLSCQNVGQTNRFDMSSRSRIHLCANPCSMEEINRKMEQIAIE